MFGWKNCQNIEEEIKKANKTLNKPQIKHWKKIEYHL